MIELESTISTVNGAVELLHRKEFLTLIEPHPPFAAHSPIYKEPFGVWFRGQADERWKLTPSVFRPAPYSDETSMVYHFNQRAGGLGEHCRNTLDWLCLMRHFQLPTRLLGWSENLLVALFFACSDDPPGLQSTGTTSNGSGRLFALNARRLNSRTRRYPPNRDEVTSPWGVEPALRAEMARSRTTAGFASLIDSFNRDYITNMGTLESVKKRELSKQPNEVLSALATPVAVFPRRLDTRMILQQSVFTVHGGKVQSDTAEGVTGTNDLPLPIGLEELSKDRSANEELLLTLRVTDKKEIQRDLKYMGIHEAALFPELDSQARYIQNQWTFPK